MTEELTTLLEVDKAAVEITCRSVIEPIFSNYPALFGYHDALPGQPLDWVVREKVLECEIKLTPEQAKEICNSLDPSEPGEQITIGVEGYCLKGWFKFEVVRDGQYLLRGQCSGVRKR